MIDRYLMVAVLAASGLLGSAASVRAASVRRNGIVYAHTAHGDLTLDACEADGPGPHPVAILVHGGGWAAGDKDGDPAIFFEPLTAARFYWFTLGYRLTKVAPWPACIDDVETGINWVCDHLAQFNGDPRRIILNGGSAGAELVAMAAMRGRLRCRPAAVVAIYTPCDLPALDRYWTQPLLRRFFGAHPPVDRLAALVGLPRSDPRFVPVLQDASPIDCVRPGLPPFLLVHGEEDGTVPIAQAYAFQAKLRAAGDRCDLIAVPHAAHGLFFPGPGSSHRLFEASPHTLWEIVGWMIALAPRSSP